jgi:gamma-glutamylcyclotransferase (GGCT)/AIG2-like uncharacterized protein YtfP
MNRHARYAFYGSLRRGMSNYLPLAHGLEFQRETQLPGFRLFALESWPYAVRTGNPKDTITVEIFRVSDPAVEKAIHELELSVGYYYDEVMWEGQDIGIYLYRQAGPETLVEGGDWVKFFRS